jgi:hypothetical protein
MEIICNYCNKVYKSYQSRSNHIRIYHKSEKEKCVPNVEKCVPNFDENSTESEVCVPKSVPMCSKNNEEVNDKNNCKFCNKNYANRHSKWKHQQICKEKDIENEIDKIKIFENEMEKKKLQLMKSMKIHPKTLQKINNQLINNGTINNGTVNNINNINTINNIIIPLSEQNLKKALKKSEKMDILNSGSKAHLKLTDILYNKPEYKKFRNIYITNLSNNIAYVFDKNKNCFIVKNKKDILDDYGVERFSDIQYFYEELKMKINDNQLIKLKKMVTDYFNDNDFKDIKNKEILIELYNNRVQVQQIYETVNKNVKEIEI